MGHNLQRIAGGSGCDIVVGKFTARRGKIYAIVVREDDTTIEHIIESNQGVTTTISSRSWIGGESSDAYVVLKANDLLIPDYPCTEIEVSAGSVIVYYDEYPWRHFKKG